MSEQLFTVDGSNHGPYPASPVLSTWGPYEPISVTRATAEQIATDLNTHDAGSGLTAQWDGPNLTFTWDERYRGAKGSDTVTPAPDGWYLIGGLWPWTQWDAPARQPDKQ